MTVCEERLSNQDSAMQPVLANATWERMIRAVEKVRERLARAVSALDQAGIPYAVTGGNAVAAWVATIDEAAVRNTQDVDLLVRRSDFEAVRTALEFVGFVHRHVAGIDMFLDGPEARARDAVHLLYAGEKVRPEYVLPAADLAESEQVAAFRVVSLDALVRMKLTSYRIKDQTHLLDMLDVGLIDASWVSRLPPELGQRLQRLIDSPEG
jgi:hypothetical protein